MKDFLLSDKSREFFVFLFFFFVAGGFWLLQTLNNDYETEFVVPVRLKGVPENVVVTSEPVSEIHIRVQDKGTVLLNYMLGKSFFPVTLNFEESGQSNRIKVGRTQFEKKITSQLNTSTRLLAITPDTLEYIYSTGKGKQVPVRLRGNVGAGQQYYLSDTIFTPDSVTVYAPAEVLDTITAAYTQWLFLENVTDTYTMWHFDENIYAKKWSATGGPRTRYDHDMANGQIRKLDEPFIVGGEKLMYPLDGSMGASAKNIVNCRCVMFHLTKEEYEKEQKIIRGP